MSDNKEMSAVEWFFRRTPAENGQQSELDRLRAENIQLQKDVNDQSFEIHGLRSEVSSLKDDNEQAYISLAIEGVRPSSLRDGIATITQQLASLKEQNALLAVQGNERWKPVGEGLPPVNTPVFLLNENRWMNTGGDDFQVNWMGAGWLVDFGGPYWSVIGETRGLTLDSVTHWKHADTPALTAYTQQVKSEDARDVEVEKAAKVIYEGWADQLGYKPWEEGGNSYKQAVARAQARASISAQEEKA